MSKQILEWDLSNLYKGYDDPKIEEDMKNIEKLAKKFSSEVKGNLIDTSLKPEQLKEWYIALEEIFERMFYLSLFSGLIYSTTSLDDNVKELKAKVEEFSVKIRETVIFFELELNLISDEKYIEFVNSADLSNYRHALEFNRLKKNHQLSEKEEQIIMMKDLTGSGGFTKLYDEIQSGFMYEFEVDGKKKEMTGSELFAFMYHKDKDVRYRALQTFVSKYKENELIFTHIYNNVLKDWDLETKRKNYERPISRRNFDNEISDKIVETLGDVTSDSNSIVERYYNLKKKVIGLDELRMSDIYAPVGEVEKKYTYEEAIELVKEVNEKFLPEFKDIIQKMYEIKHIDVTPRKGKTGGAFCSYGRQIQYPFVFVNFTGDIESVLTLAHELGHALHHYHIQQNQTFTNIGSSLAVAEIASVFNEILTFDYLMKQNLSKDEKIALLCNHIEGNFSTSHRQNAFYQFERRVHELMKTKLPSTQDYKEIYVEEMEKMFGNSVSNIKEDYEIYCFVVSHFIQVPFYVYAYNMANLLVIALYQMYLEEKDEFKPKFVKLLSVGTSLTPEQMLAEIGVDLNDPTFWQKGINYLTNQIDKLEELLS